jgi:hypothetical protein
MKVHISFTMCDGEESGITIPCKKAAVTEVIEKTVKNLEKHGYKVGPIEIITEDK